MDNLYPLKYPVKGVDLAYESRLEELFKQYKPKTIFNFAAETHVDNSINNVAPFIDTNVIGTINLLNYQSSMMYRCFIIYQQMKYMVHWN